MFNVNPGTLSPKDKKFIKETKALMEVTDKLLGKPILGCWSPLGQVRDPDTADDPKLARKLMKANINKYKKL